MPLEIFSLQIPGSSLPGLCSFSLHIAVSCSCKRNSVKILSVFSTEHIPATQPLQIQIFVFLTLWYHALLECVLWSRKYLRAESWYYHRAYVICFPSLRSHRTVLITKRSFYRFLSGFLVVYSNTVSPTLVTLLCLEVEVTDIIYVNTVKKKKTQCCPSLHPHPHTSTANTVSVMCNIQGLI